MAHNYGTLPSDQHPDASALVGVLGLSRSERDELRQEAGADATDEAVNASCAELNDSFTAGVSSEPLVADTSTASKLESPLEPDTGRWRGATAPPTIIRNVAYTPARIWNQAVDVYLPAVPKGAPVVIHIHGGGWSRGDRTSVFYGAPPVCTAYAAMGYVAVAVGYRLGNFQHFMHDCAAAIAWISENIGSLAGCEGADVNRIVLSGHSAGAHIVALLLTDPSFLCAVQVPFEKIRGAILLSGIYALKNPFGPNPSGIVNWGFQRLYIKRAFTAHGASLNEASPAWRVVRSLPEEEPLLALEAQTEKKLCYFARAKATAAGSPSKENCTETRIAPLPIAKIPVTLFNATWDLGLAHDGQRFYNLLNQLGNRSISYFLIPNTRHATICRSGETFSVLAEAIPQMLAR